MAAPAKDSTKSKVIVEETSPYSVNKSLFEESTKIKNKRELIERRLQKMEEHRSEVNDSVYFKVKTDYETQLEEVNAAFQDKCNEIEGELRNLYQAKAEQEGELAKHQEVLEEAKFRHTLGEYTEKKYKEIDSQQNKEIKQYNSVLDIIKNSIGQYENILGQPFNPEAIPTTVPEKDFLVEDMVAGLETHSEEIPPTPKETEHTPATGIPFGTPVGDETGKTGDIPEGSLTDAKMAPEGGGLGDNLDDELDSFLQTEGDYFSGTEEAGPKPEAPPLPQEAAQPKKKKPEKVSESKPDDDSISKILQDIPIEEATAEPKAAPSIKEEATGPKLESSGVDQEASLLLIEGELEDHEIILSENTSFGRSPSNDVVLKETKVSRQHCAINFRDGNYVLVDLKSANGVLVNEEKVEEAALRDGDELRIGSFKFQFNLL